MKQFLLLLITVQIFQSSAYAIFEMRMSYGFLNSKPDIGSLYTGTSIIPSSVPNTGIGADSIYVLPVFGLGAGIRYENLGFTSSATGLEYKSQIARTAFVINYRLINNIAYLGPIVTAGISHSSTLRWTDINASTSADFAPRSVNSYTLGLEGGFGFVGFILGLEAGYQSMKWEQLVDSGSFITSTPDIDMSGAYAKIVFGFGI